MIATPNAFHKNNVRMYYHLVQSFPKGDDATPGLAHQIAVELAEKVFGNYECIVATHINRENIHPHYKKHLSKLKKDFIKITLLSNQQGSEVDSYS